MFLVIYNFVLSYQITQILCKFLCHQPFGTRYHWWFNLVESSCLWEDHLWPLQHQKFAFPIWNVHLGDFFQSISFKCIVVHSMKTILSFSRHFRMVKYTCSCPKMLQLQGKSHRCTNTHSQRKNTASWAIMKWDESNALPNTVGNSSAVVHKICAFWGEPHSPFPLYHQCHSENGNVKCKCGVCKRIYTLSAFKNT